MARTEPQEPEKIATPRGKLPPAAEQNLSNFLKVRGSEVELPEFLEELEGTNGWLTGDGSKDRVVPVGWKPAFVVITCPPFPNGSRRPQGKGFFRPPLHDQPEYTEKGFKLPPELNEEGSMVSWVAWKPKA